MTTENDLLGKAVKELNEKDAEGAVAKIKVQVKLVQANNAQIEVLQKNNQELLKEIGKLTAAGGLRADQFVVPAQG